MTAASSRLFQLIQLVQEQRTYPGTKLVGEAFELRKRMKNSPSCAHVLHKTLNLVISPCCFAEDGKGIVPKLKSYMQRDCFYSLNVLFCGVVVAVAVVVA